MYAAIIRSGRIGAVKAGDTEQRSTVRPPSVNGVKYVLLLPIIFLIGSKRPRIMDKARSREGFRG